jgi:hypothetical protein
LPGIGMTDVSMTITRHLLGEWRSTATMRYGGQYTSR